MVLMWFWDRFPSKNLHVCFLLKKSMVNAKQSMISAKNRGKCGNAQKVPRHLLENVVQNIGFPRVGTFSSFSLKITKFCHFR